MNKQIKQILYYNQKALVGSEKNFRAIFEIMFRNRDCILCEDNDGFRVTKHSYGEVHDKIVSAAAGLHAKIGATGGYVALEMENSVDWIVAFWAILMSGNKPYLVNLRYPRHLSNSILKTLSITHSVCIKETQLDVQPIEINSLYCNLPALDGSLFADEIAFSTSATSMNEVVCFYSGYQIAEQILNFKSIVKECPEITKHYKGSLKQLAFLPFYHVFGLFAVYFWFTFFGRTIVFLRDYSADTILKTCRRHEVTHIFAVPMLWHTIEKQVLNAVKEQGDKKQKKFEKALKAMTAVQNISPLFGQWLAKRVLSEVTDKLFGKSVMFCINGGSYLRQSAMELFNGIGYSMHNGYGMSEIGITSVELRRKPKHRNLNSIGRPFDSVEYRIDDGILWVKGSSLCSNKLVNGEKIEVNGWFNTEDSMEEKDGYYYILGRLSDVVIGENGENINPNAVEQQFDLDEAITVSVLGIKNDCNDELSLVVQINPYLPQDKLDFIIDKAKQINGGLSNTYAVKRFYFTYDNLIEPNAIKVSRKQLAQKIAQGNIKLIPFADIKQGVQDCRTDSPLLAQVKQVIAQELGISAEDIESGAHLFFDLGATSMQYFSILTALSEEFKINSYNETDKYCYTAKDICEYIERRI